MRHDFLLSNTILHDVLLYKTMQFRGKLRSRTSNRLFDTSTDHSNNHGKKIYTHMYVYKGMCVYYRPTVLQNIRRSKISYCMI